MSTTLTAVEDKNFEQLLATLNVVLAAPTGPSAEVKAFDPRLIGQTVSSILKMCGVGEGKAFIEVDREEAMSDLKAKVAPHLNDPVFMNALGSWVSAAVEPIASQKSGKAYIPASEKGFFDDFLSTAQSVAKNVPWDQVVQTGIQVLPLVMSLV